MTCGSLPPRLFVFVRIKVGGLPLPELNQLELQFLLLNDFRLVISSEEMQRYAEQLILFSRSSGMIGGVGVDAVGAGGVGAGPSTGAAPMTGGIGVAAPMSAMGAIDAYGGRVADDGRRTRTSPSASASSTSSRSSHGSTYADADTSASTAHQQGGATEEEEEDAETETEVGTEDGDEASSTNTTDDEPTIRAASVADRARRRESIDEVMADAVECVIGEGERTPERRRTWSYSSDANERMSSP